MPKYLTLFSFKGEAMAALIENPSNREEAVRKLAESIGGSLEAYYLMFGQYDGCVIYDAPDSASAAVTVVAVTSSGAFSRLETHELMTADQFLEILSRAKSITSYKPPGS
ncbi:MAG TPA: GYD domain-containing protein [Actinomycetota bacterium]|nr:GYD domain-containing protein [Actinomycetota bacterium]